MFLHSLIVFMNYNEAFDYITQCQNIRGSVLGLDSITELTKRLGNPQNHLKFIHIAGTNGKGSTLAYISTVLKESGYKTGRYISPTIREYLERFQVNERLMPKTVFARLCTRVKEVCDEMAEEGLCHPTAFEIETAIAFLYFAEKKCDVVVLETGLGGRLDATNIINPILCVLTSISMDHMQFLGDSLDKIAAEKCGIIKDNVHVVTMQQKCEAMQVIEETCRQKNASLIVLSEDEISKVKYGLSKQNFTIDNTKIEIKLSGVVQISNAALAYKAVTTLRDECGLHKITTNTIQKGLQHTEWPARFMVVNKKPLILIDGAHNEDAAIKLRSSIDTYFAEKRKIYIIGMFRDKEVDKVVDIICKDGDMIFTVAAPNNPRALSSVELAERIKKVNTSVTATDSIEEALEFATGIADENSVVIACGSLAYLGKIIDIYSIK